MSKPYDLVVIGTGVAAMSTALTVRAAGRTVAIIDHRPYGGTCALRGCDPKKVLVGAVQAVDHVQRLSSRGVEGESFIDWPGLIAFKRSFTDPVPEQRQQTYAQKGIDMYHGWARFTGRDSLSVDGEDLSARQVLLATGAEAVPLPIAGAEHLVTSEGFMSLTALPKRIVLVGGGYIAAEVSCIAALAGAQVTVLQRSPRLLPPFDADLVGWLMNAFQAHGIEVRTNMQVEAIERNESNERNEKNGSAFRVNASSAGQRVLFEADLVLHAAGRAPDWGPLNLDAAGIETDQGRLRLNEYLQSVSNPAVYAAGDAAQAGPPLTPVASHDAQVVAVNLLQGNQRKPDYFAVPSVAFSIPPIASVGLSEAKAREQGLRFRVSSQLASDWYTARQQAEPVYGFKILIEENTGRILGAHLVGPHADEVINIFALAIRQRLNADTLKSMIFAYPTGSSDIESML